MKIVQASEKHLEGVVNLCNCSIENMRNNGIDQWDETNLI